MRALRILLAVVAVLGLGVGIALASNPPRPTARDQALKDGCQRSDFGIGFNQTPEWVYVYRNPTIRTASGVVHISHNSLEDSVLEHRSFDYNGNLVPDAPYRYLIAGSQTKHTNNYSLPKPDEEYGRLHFEWESATLPFFAWPTDGDRATLWGSWIWDCGHWQSGSENNTGGTTTGEHSELHPLNGIAVQRHSPYLSSRGESETDVFISTQGDASHAVEKCALSHHPDSSQPPNYPHYDKGFTACAENPANRIQPLAKSYQFFVPAPAKPSSKAKLRYRMVTQLAHETGTQQVHKKANGIEVTVKVPSSKHVVSYGKSFLVSWSVPPRHKPTPLEVTIKSIKIHKADPNPQLKDPSGANWNLYLDINGYWQLINNWAPKLTSHVTNGEQIAVNRKVKIYLPAGAKLWFQVTGRECDEPAGYKVLGVVYATVLYPCPANTDEKNYTKDIHNIFNNDDPGTILDIYSSPTAALGTHSSTSKATVNFPGSGLLTFADGKQGQGNYTITYKVSKG